MSWLSTRIAVRYIFSRKSHSAINLISVVAVCGVVVASVALVCVLSVFNGFHSLIEGKLSVIDPAVKVVPATGKAISSPDSLIDVITAVPGVAYAIPGITEQALARCGDKQLPVMVKGVVENYDSLSAISSVVKEDGEFLLSNDYGMQFMVISVGTAISLETRPGYRTPVSLYAPKRKGRVNVANPIGAFRADTMFVSGVFQVDEAGYDASTVLVPLDVARRLFDYPVEATEIEVGARSDADEAALHTAIATALPGYVVKNRLQQHASSYRLINIEKWITFLLLSFILLIAAFNVISTVSVLIVEKTGDIATLRNLGATRALITRIFSTQALLITFIGSLIGVAIGVVLCLAQQHLGIIKLNGTPGTLILDAYPVVVEWSDLVVVLAMAIAVGALASLVTAAVMRFRLSR